MDATDIEYLQRVFAQPRIMRALTEVRAAIQVRGDLALGDEGLMIYRDEDGSLTATSFRIELDDSRSEFEARLTDVQLEAAKLLWEIGLANTARVERQIADPIARLEYLSSQGDQLALRLGLRLNEHEEDHLSIYPGPLPKP